MKKFESYEDFKKSVSELLYDTAMTCELDELNDMPELNNFLSEYYPDVNKLYLSVENGGLLVYSEPLPNGLVMTVNEFLDDYCKYFYYDNVA